MAVVNPPIFIHQESHPADRWRRALGAMFSRPGVVGVDALKVTENGTPNMSVNVAEGIIVIRGTENTYQGTYICEAQGVTNVPIAAAHATLSRNDIVVARVRDSNYSGGTRSFAIEALAGTPGGPVAAVPANAWVLAHVNVPAADTAITNAQIADVRYGTLYANQAGGAAALGGISPFPEAVPVGVGSPTDGMVFYSTASKTYFGYNAASAHWYPIASLAALTPHSPQIQQGAGLFYSVNYSGYQRLGRQVIWTFHFDITSAGTSGQAVTMTLPLAAADAQSVQGSFHYQDTGTINLAGAINPSGTNLVQFMPAGQSNVLGIVGLPGGAAAGDVLNGLIVYEAAVLA